MWEQGKFIKKKKSKLVCRGKQQNSPLHDGGNIYTIARIKITRPFKNTKDFKNLMQYLKTKWNVKLPDDKI